MLAQVARDAWYAPAHIRQAHHLQPIAHARRQALLAGALPQFVALLVR
jgi:hypothetical protein